MDLLIITVTIFWPFTVGVLVLAFWVVELAGKSSRIVQGAATGLKSTGRGIVRCKNGHTTVTAGGLYQCQGCGFVYEGSIWLCENPECKAVTPFIDCGTCGISVRSPFRVG